jgi:phosphatidylglycerol lysyltransferase
VSGLLQKAVSHVSWPKVGIALSILFAAAVWAVLYHLLREISWGQVREAITQVSNRNAGLALIATVVSYAALAGYDVLALRQVGASQISLRFAAFTSFIAQAFTFTLGFSLLTGGAVRLRLYQSKGLQPSRIIAAGLLCSATFWLGLTAAGGVSLLFAPRFLSTLDGLAPALNTGLGLGTLAALAAWIAYTARKPRFVQVGSWDLRLPGPWGTLLSILCGLADAAAASLALWLLIPGQAGVSYPAFLIVFTAATLLGVISNAPGGLGVFEAVILLSLRDAPHAGLLASLLLFRLIYYFVPFAIAALLFAIFEIRTGAWRFSRLRVISAITKPFVPPVTAAAVFTGAFILLVSGALPALQDRMAVLKRWVPLPFVETSHFLASVTGALLLVVAYGLQQKLRSAWLSAIVLLSAAAIFSLFKGIDYEESILCSAVIGLLWFGQSEFYRKGGLLDTGPSPEWAVAALIAAAASMWIGAVIYHNSGYANNLWWDFTYRGDEPRFLRASLGISSVFLIVLSYRLLHKSAPMREPATEEELARAWPIIAASPRAEANLACLGDKRLMFSPDGSGFIMYGVRGRSWIAMGDPVVPEGRGIHDLVWQFRELADQHRGIPVFYQATTAHLPAYLDAGFSMAKLGEEAWVDLSKFTLEGKEGRRIRQNKAAAERTEAVLEIVPAAELDSIMPDLKRVSDAWLRARGGGEKGFSLGFWSEPYLRHYDHAVIRHFGEIVAFANIWKSANNEEYSVDLMRHTPGAPPGMMDLLFISLMEQAKAEGFHWFNLGMAPLSGLPDHRLANLWSRFATLVFRYGDRFYNFSGLRSFKNKFKPDWRPRYLAYPGGTLAKVLVDVTALIARSPARVPSKTGNDLT